MKALAEAPVVSTRHGFLISHSHCAGLLARCTVMSCPANALYLYRTLHINNIAAFLPKDKRERGSGIRESVVLRS